MAYSVKHIRQFESDLRQFIEDVENYTAVELAKTILDQLSMEAPRDTGRLQNSGFAYVGSKLVATSNYEGLAQDAPPRISRPDNFVTIIFKAVKPAKENANVYYVAGGGKWFDYAIYVFAERGMAFVSGAMSPENINPVIDKAVRKAWSKQS